MTKETKVLNSTIFISLDDGATKWADTILDNYQKYKRENTTKEISSNNFNIKDEAIKLENEYLKFIRRINN